MTEHSENFDNVTEYYAQLTNESKIYFANTLFKLGLERDVVSCFYGNLSKLNVLYERFS